MIAYHGSDSNFKHLRISKALVKRSSTMANEGPGIYFSTDKSVASSYGRYLYVLEINDEYLLDFRNARVCIKYLTMIRQEILLKSKIDLARFIDITRTGEYMSYGGMAICGTCREIMNLLDANEKWYRLAESRRALILKCLSGFDKKHLKAYMFTYSIINTGVIKDVSSDIVQIIHKDRIR